MLSVIVPVYNAEKTIGACIESIISALSMDFELVIVDDGSTDSSLLICQSYSKYDNRIKVLHKENGGVSAARNFALEKVQGDWILFVDADDLLTDKIEIQLDSNIDLYVGGVKRTSSNSLVSPPEMVTTISDALAEFDYALAQIYFTTIWTKFFKKDIIDKYKIRFSDHLRIGEDTVFLLSYIQNAKMICLCNSIWYIYNDCEVNGLDKYALKPLEFKKHAFAVWTEIDNLKKLYGYHFKNLDSTMRLYYSRLFFQHILNTNGISQYIEIRNDYIHLGCSYYPDSNIKKLWMSLFLRMPRTAYFFISLYRLFNTSLKI